MQRTAYIIALLIFSVLILSGCGIYTFSGNIPGHLKSVAIPTFENQTPEFGLAEDLTDALVEKFTTDGSLKIRDPKNADSIVYGTIMRVVDAPVGFNKDESVDEYKVTIALKVVFEDKVKGKILLEENISQFGLYPFSSGSRAERQEGLDEAIEKIVEDILNKIVSGW